MFNRTDAGQLGIGLGSHKILERTPAPENPMHVRKLEGGKRERERENERVKVRGGRERM